MENDRILTSKKTIFGLKPTDMLGILIMIIPFLISFMNFTLLETGPKYQWWFFRFGKITTETSVNLNPGLISALCAVAFYFPLIIRLDLYKAETLLEGIISVIRTFLNCFVIAAFLSIIISSEHIDTFSFGGIFRNYKTVFLFLAIVLSWIGMRSISGYCWILFIIAAYSSFLAYDKAMKLWGAVFVISLSISLFLQISAHVKAADFVKEFRGSTSAFTSTVRGNMSAAAADAAQRVENAATFVKDNVAAYTPLKIRRNPQSHASPDGRPVYYVGKNTPQSAPAPSRSMPDGNAGDILKALDVNGDGVVDEKDIELLKKR